MSELINYYFSQDGLFVIPVEHLSREGLTPEYRQTLLQKTVLGATWVDLFERAFKVYWARLEELFARAPAFWFPPRVQHICIVTDSKRVRPYFQPFHKSAWLLYMEDFDPRISNVEFAVFQFLQVERMSLLQQVAPVLGSNLGYWLTRTDGEIRDFCRACGRSQRPDFYAYRALAKAMPWIRGLHHDVLRPLPEMPEQSMMTVPGSGLRFPRSRQPDVDRLFQSWVRAIEGVAENYYQAHHNKCTKSVLALCEWLAEKHPRLLLMGRGGRILWDMEKPRVMDHLRQELSGAASAAVESLHADLSVIDRHCTNFINALTHPEKLPRPQPHSADQNGLSYMHIERREVAYNIHEEGMQRLREPAPAYERLMLGARTIHEWGHLAVEAGWVPIKEGCEQEHQNLLGQTAMLFDEIIDRAPPALIRLCAHSIARQAAPFNSPGAAFTALSLARMEDFQANLLSQRFLSRFETETYVRNNVRTHINDYPRDAYFQRLARYVYEYQYLGFSRLEDPWGFFMKSTWFHEQYLKPGVLSEALFQQLVALVGRICATYAVDERWFNSKGLEVQSW